MGQLVNHPLNSHLFKTHCHMPSPGLSLDGEGILRQHWACRKTHDWIFSMRPPSIYRCSALRGRNMAVSYRWDKSPPTSLPMVAYCGYPSTVEIVRRSGLPLTPPWAGDVSSQILATASCQQSCQPAHTLPEQYGILVGGTLRFRSVLGSHSREDRIND